MYNVHMHVLLHNTFYPSNITGSADAERSFSVMKIIRGTDRNRLLPEVVEHLVRIKMNGLPVRLFNAEKYTSSYLEDPQNYR